MYLQVSNEQQAKQISADLYQRVCHHFMGNVSKYLIGWTQDKHGAWFLMWDPETDFRPFDDPTIKTLADLKMTNIVATIDSEESV